MGLPCSSYGIVNAATTAAHTALRSNALRQPTASHQSKSRCWLPCRRAAPTQTPHIVSSTAPRDLGKQHRDPEEEGGEGGREGGLQNRDSSYTFFRGLLAPSFSGLHAACGQWALPEGGWYRRTGRPAPTCRAHVAGRASSIAAETPSCPCRLLTTQRSGQAP